MKTMSEKTKRYLQALQDHPEATVNSLAQKHKIAVGYAYKLAKKVRGTPVSAVVNEIQVGGEHYKKNAVQPWDYIVSNELGYLEGNIVKYVTRWKSKGGRQDLEKARHYLDKLLEVA